MIEESFYQIWYSLSTHLWDPLGVCFLLPLRQTIQWKICQIINNSARHWPIVLKLDTLVHCGSLRRPRNCDNPLPVKFKTFNLYVVKIAYNREEQRQDGNWLLSVECRIADCTMSVCPSVNLVPLQNSSKRDSYLVSLWPWLLTFWPQNLNSSSLSQTAPQL